jgi:hypothetical protein
MNMNESFTLDCFHALVSRDPLNTAKGLHCIMSEKIRNALYKLTAEDVEGNACGLF